MMDDRLADLVAEVFAVEPNEVREDMTPDNVEMWDSFNHVVLIMTIEESYGIKLDPSEATSVRSVGDIRALIDKRATPET